jgi:hypothetical protein
MRLPNDRTSLADFPSPWTTDGSNPAPGIPSELDATLDDILWSEYTADGASIFAVRYVAGLRDFLGFRAEGFHQRGPYSYARLIVTHDLVPLAWGQCCVDQPDSRGKIADAAWLALEPSVKLGISRQQIRRYVDTFCYRLEVAWGELLPTRFSGGIAVQ